MSPAYWSIPNFYFGISRQMIVISMTCPDDQDEAAVRASWIGSTIEGSSFSGLLTRVEIGHIRIGSAGNGRI
jgi:hypothetical protein